MGDTTCIKVVTQRPKILIDGRSAHHDLQLATPRRIVARAPLLATLTRAETQCSISFGGTQGPAGIALRARLVKLGDDLAAYTAVYQGSDGKAYAADAQTGQGIRALIGILTQGGLSGDLRPVQQRDVLEISNANFVHDRPVIVGIDGALQQGKPAGFLWHAPIGRALSSTLLEIDIDTPIERIV